MFTAKSEAKLCGDFVGEVETINRPTAKVIRERLPVQQQQRDQRKHSAFLKRKVDVARRSVGSQPGRDNAAVEADFAARRARITDSM